MSAPASGCALPAGYELVDDQALIDPVAAHAFLTRSYWAEGISLDKVRQALGGSLCVAVRYNGQQVGMARVVTDYVAIAYLNDVHVIEEHRGKGLSKALVAHLQAHPDLQGVRRWMLVTADAQGLYSQLGWVAAEHPEWAMERLFKDAYQ